MESACPGQNVTFTCTIPSSTHQWMVPSLSISRTLTQYDMMASDDPFQFAVRVLVRGTSRYIESTATVTATEGLNGTTVLCQHRNRETQNNTVKLIGKHLIKYSSDYIMIAATQLLIAHYSYCCMCISFNVCTMNDHSVKSLELKVMVAWLQVSSWVPRLATGNYCWDCSLYC